MTFKEMRDYQQHALQDAGGFFFIAAEDYVGARCLILNALASGFPLAAQAIEKLLKAALCMDGIKPSRSHSTAHLLAELAKSSARYRLDEYRDLCGRLDEYYRRRYHDNSRENYGATSEDLAHIDRIWFHIVTELPLPDEFKYRTKFFVDLCEGNPYWRADVWLLKDNAVLAPQFLAIKSRYDEVRQYVTRVYRDEAQQRKVSSP